MIVANLHRKILLGASDHSPDGRRGSTDKEKRGKKSERKQKAIVLEIRYRQHNDDQRRHDSRINGNGVSKSSAVSNRTARPTKRFVAPTGIRQRCDG